MYCSSVVASVKSVAEETQMRRGWEGRVREEEGRERGQEGEREGGRER